jgi:GDPmannose 4,6-dehydratase
VEWSAKAIGVTLKFSGEGINEIGTVVSVNENSGSINIGDIILRIDTKYYRPTEVESLLGDPSKAEEVLGWKPLISVEEMCTEMMEEDLKIAKKEFLINNS